MRPPLRPLLWGLCMYHPVGTWYSVSDQRSISNQKRGKGPCFLSFSDSHPDKCNCMVLLIGDAGAGLPAIKMTKALAAAVLKYPI